MTRLSTRLRDRQIMSHLRAGEAPKEIVASLNLSSSWIVYDMIRRKKSKIIQSRKHKS